MNTDPVPGTLRCYRLPDRSDVGPFWARCGCGWWREGAPSKRRTKVWWHHHIRLVRDSLRRAS